MAIGKKRNAGICLLCCCLIAVLFTCCGNSSPEDTSDQVYYHIQETAIPDPNEELVDVFGNAENTIIWEMDMVQRDGIFYRIALCREMNGYSFILSFLVSQFVEIRQVIATLSRGEITSLCQWY